MQAFTLLFLSLKNNYPVTLYPKLKTNLCPFSCQIKFHLSQIADNRYRLWSCREKTEMSFFFFKELPIWGHHLEVNLSPTQASKKKGLQTCHVYINPLPPQAAIVTFPLQASQRTQINSSLGKRNQCVLYQKTMRRALLLRGPAAAQGAPRAQGSSHRACCSEGRGNAILRVALGSNSLQNNIYGTVSSSAFREQYRLFAGEILLLS